MDDTFVKCLVAPADRLILITVNCSSGLCLDDLAGLCDDHFTESMMACVGARNVATGGGVLGDITPNFIIADWTQKRGNIVAEVQYFNWQILLQNGFPAGSPAAPAGDLRLEHFGDGELTFTGFE